MNAILSTRPLPTLRDEDWRYADIAALDRLAPGAFDSWQDLAVPEGERIEQAHILGGPAPQLRRIRLDVAAGAQAALFAVLAGDDYTRLEVEVTLAQGAHFEFGAVTIGGGTATREVITRVNHAQPDSTSRQIVRAVHWGQATGNYLGRIAVARDAQKSDAAQSFKGLLLEKGASANAKPELEIFADDVKCAHGAAIGQLDETARFYMAARGIPPETARALLVCAFIADAFAQVSDEAERDNLLAAALAVLDHRT